MNAKRVIALIAALAIPVLYIITIILFIMGSDYANLFLAVSLGGTFFPDTGRLSADQSAERYRGSERKHCRYVKER